MEMIGKKINASDSLDIKDDQALQEEYIEASTDPDRLKTIEEWEFLDQQDPND